MSLPRGTGPGLFEKFAGRGWAKIMVRSMGKSWENHGITVLLGFKVSFFQFVNQVEQMNFKE
jgi:hypothetical protein